MADPQKNTEPPKCAGGCGFFGNPACENFCSKCYRDRYGPESFVSAASKSSFTPTPSTPLVSAMTASMPTASSSSSSSSSSSAAATTTTTTTTNTAPAIPDADGEAQAESPTPSAKKSKKKKKKNRCQVCNTKLGMMSFDCRCEGLFCAKHRLPDDHECTFDFKSFDREKIAKANQAMTPEKLKNRI